MAIRRIGPSSFTAAFLASLVGVGAATGAATRNVLGPDDQRFATTSQSTAISGAPALLATSTATPPRAGVTAAAPKNQSRLGRYLPAPAFHQERVIVRFRPNMTAAAKEAAHEKAQAGDVVRASTEVPDLFVLKVPGGQIDEAVAAYRADPAVLYAEPDYRVKAYELPDDALFQRLWGLQNDGQTVNGDPGLAGVDIHIAEAWSTWTGDPDFRIAVIDSGVDYTHPDLAANMWTNPDEVPDNGVDDDGNGWIDDVHGFDALGGRGDIRDENGHGTHVAGTIAAVGNNAVGVVGVNWRAALVGLRFLDRDGYGYTSDAVEAMEYVISSGIKVSNNSWGCDRCFSQALYDVIERSQSVGHIFVAAAGNGIFGMGVDTELYPGYPAAYDLPNIISVAAIDNNGNKAKFSNYGATTVDLGAPGVETYSTDRGGGYAFHSGTSMAAPHVSGVVALMWSHASKLGWTEVRQRLFATVRPLPGLAGKTVTGGIVDAAAALGDCNSNGHPDEDDIGSGASGDCNSNGVPDECEADCNGNLIVDACEITSGSAPDCNRNGRPDACETAADADCDENGTNDFCEIASGAADCNRNGIPDGCDLRDGRSQDCNGTLTPDECEVDCNRNGLADSCDLLTGTSVDLNHDEVPDECPQGFALVPISASGSHEIRGNEIVLRDRGERVLLEIRVSGWDPDRDGEPRLKVYEAAIDTDGFVSGTFGSLHLATSIPCSNNDNCLADSLCDNTGYCDPYGAIGIDEAHPEFVFWGRDTLSLSRYIEKTSLGSLVFPWDLPIFDPGVDRYAGTLVLDVSPHAAGTFTVGLRESIIDTFLIDEHNAYIAIRDFTPALFILEVDCNSNGVTDLDDITSGASVDCNANTTPDECESAADCNANGVQDICDTASGSSTDCNGNEMPDECEPDCNANGRPDPCDVSQHRSDDHDGNGVPDECQPNKVVLVGQSVCPFVGDGTLSTPFCRIQDGIKHAIDGDEVIVADGLYRGQGNRDLDFGGRLIAVRSANGPERCIIDVEGGFGRGFVFRNRESSAASVRGLTIRNATRGIYIDRSSPTIEGCRVTQSTVGIYVFGVGSAYQPAPLISRCILAYNGSGFTAETSSPHLDGCLIVNNRRGITLTGSEAHVSNCTIANNYGTVAGGGLYLRDSRLRIWTSIIWGNWAPIGSQAYAISSSRLSIDWCDVETVSGSIYLDASSEVFWGQENTHEDPRFVGSVVGWHYPEALAEDYMLGAGSPCVDTDAHGALPLFDVLGNPRVQGCRVDMGALEAAGARPPCDFNGDAWIDLKDFAALQICGLISMSRPRSEEEDACLCAFDHDTDGDLSRLDFADFLRR